MVTKGNTTFSVNDILRIKDGISDEWMKVLSVVDSKHYFVERDKASSYTINSNPTWKRGATIVNYGQSGDGGIYMTSSEANAPYLDVFTHAGSPWTTITTKARLGSLKGIVDSDLGLNGDDVYGLYTDNAFIKGLIVGSTIKIPNVTSPAFQVDSLGNVVVASLKRKDFHWFTVFESIDGYQINATNSGTVTLNTGGGFVRFLTGTSNGNTSELLKTIITDPQFTWSKARSFKTLIRPLYNTNQFIIIGTGGTQLSGGSLQIQNQFGFYIDNGTLYGYCSDATAVNYGVNLGSITANNYYTLEAVFTPGVDIKYYVNDTYIDKVTTNLPTGESFAFWLFDFTIKTKTGAAREMYVSYYDFWQAF